MRSYLVICRDAQGRECWSLTQEAESPAWAVARTCLPSHLREAYVKADCPCHAGVYVHPTSFGYTVEVQG